MDGMRDAGCGTMVVGLCCVWVSHWPLPKGDGHGVHCGGGAFCGMICGGRVGGVAIQPQPWAKPWQPSRNEDRGGNCGGRGGACGRQWQSWRRAVAAGRGSRGGRDFRPKAFSQKVRCPSQDWPARLPESRQSSAISLDSWSFRTGDFSAATASPISHGCCIRSSLAAAAAAIAPSKTAILRPGSATALLAANGQSMGITVHCACKTEGKTSAFRRRFRHAST